MPKRGTAARIDAAAAKKNSGRPCCAVTLLTGALSVVAVLTQGVLLAQWQVNTGGFARPRAGSMRYGGLYGARSPALPSQNRFARASDGFLPMPDTLEVAAEAGVTALVEPGGSKGDQRVIEAANARGVALLFTGRRHFRH